MPDVLNPPPFTSAIAEDPKDRLKTTVVTAVWKQWFLTLAQYINSGNGGYTGTVALAKLTSGGANGSLTVVDGIITEYTAPT